MTNKRNYNPRYQNNYDRYGVGNYRRTTCTMKGEKFFEKTFEKKEWAEKYLAAVKRNRKGAFYYSIKENNQKTYTLKLFKAEYWEE